MTESDEQLLKQVGLGETSSFVKLYERYAPRLLALLVKLLRDRQHADDVLQETFWQVWRTAANYDASRATPATWILMIAKSRAIDTMRRQKRNSTVTLGEGPATQQDPSRSIQSEELSQRVRSAFMQLESNQEQALRLAIFDGLSHQEIASQLQVPLGTVKTRIRQGMIRLRTILRNLGIEATS